MFQLTKRKTMISDIETKLISNNKTLTMNLAII